MEVLNSVLNLMDTSTDQTRTFSDIPSERLDIFHPLIPNEHGFDLDSYAGDEDGDAQSSHEVDDVILSVYWKRGKLGAAYYTYEGSELHVLNDLVDVHPDFINLRSLLNQVQPSQVITCGGLAESFTKTVKELVNPNAKDNEENNNICFLEPTGKLHFLSGKKKDLSYDSCKRHILGLKFGFEPESLSEEDHVLFVNSYIDFKQESLVMSLGMLIKFLEKYLPQKNLAYDIIPIMLLRHISLKNVVSIDEVTYKALQIFNVRHHPSAFKRNSSGCNKEGLSIFGIFNRCKSTIGVKKMREMFTSPSRDIDELNARLDAIEFCVQPQHQHIVSNMVDCIRRIESVTGILGSIYRTRAKIYQWKALYTSLYNAILIGQICQTYSKQSQLFQKISNSITDDIYEVTHYINQVIDFEESSLKNQFTVRIGIDKQLDRMRQTYAQVPEVLIKVAQLELEDLPEYIEQCSIVYITELGYLLSVPIWKNEANDVGEYYLPNFEVKFIVNKFVHYKTPRCTELDNVLGDMLLEMAGIESKIMVMLIQFIHQRVETIVETIKLISELDCVIALATIASENNYRRPTLTKERNLTIVKGRHPLQELCVDNFVPNDSCFNAENGLIKILTGPNASGKSVYLKQIALIAYLAHIGSFVPAQSATIGILDHIHSRIQTIESVSTRMSAFLLDLKQMSYSLYNSTASSLIVIDEFGKGTTEIDGLSLLAASLIHFIERGINCPYVLVSTHFHNLPSLLPQSSLVHLQFMNYIIEKDEIVYLHQIKNGTAGSSLTHLAAKTAGLAEAAISRSMKILEGSEVCKSNSKLEVTKTMMKEVLYMKKLFALETETHKSQETVEEPITGTND